jgi:synaptosomal-associated protein 25
MFKWGSKKSKKPSLTSDSDNKDSTRQNSFENQSYLDEFDLKLNKKVINNSQKINDTFGTREEELDLRLTQQKIGQVENESLESTRRALQTINETYDIGANTAAELVRQGEQLRSIDENLDEVEQNLKNTQRNIKKMNRGMFTGFFADLLSKNEDAKGKKSKLKNEEQSNLNKSINNSLKYSATYNKKADHSIITGSEREKEMNDNLDEISKGLSRLTAMASEMSYEIDKQTPVIDRIAGKVDRTHFKINTQNSAMRKNLQQ